MRIGLIFFVISQIVFSEPQLSGDARLFKKACDEGEMSGCFNLGNVEEEAGNKTEAHRLWKKACDGGNMGGCSNLGLLEQEAGNKTEAHRLLKKACDGGFISACPK